MKRMFYGTVGALTAAVIFGSCAGAVQEQRFQALRETVQERTALPIQRIADPEAEARAAEAVSQLLAEPLTLESAVQIALLNNRQLQALYEELGIAAAGWIDAGLLENPLLRAVVPVGNGDESAGTPWTVEVEWNVLSLFTRPLRRGAASPALDAAERRVAGAVLEVVRQVRAAYYQTLAAQARVELFQQATQAAESAELFAQRLREAGNITEFDRLSQVAFAQRMRLALEQALAARDLARERLNALLGLWGEQTVWELPGRLPDPPESLAKMEGLESEAIAGNLELAALRRELTATARELGVLNATRWVQDLEVGAEAERATNGASSDWEANPALTLPIPLFDRSQGNRTLVAARLRQLIHRYTAQAVDVRAAARAVRRRIQTAHQVARYYRSSVLPVQEQLVQRALLRYNAMQIGVFQLLAAKEAQIQAANQYLDALLEYWLAWNDLEILRSGGSLPVGGTVALSVGLETSPQSEGGH